MASSPNSVEPPDEPDPSSYGELIVENGRLSGTRCPLSSPLTLIGQGDGCEVRLNYEGIHAYHCAIGSSPDGYVLRDLGSPTGTQVNSQSVTTCLLHPGDRIGVGPFLFRIEFIPPVPVQKFEDERDALRIQAAAVVAQQAALTEEEIRLSQKAGALDRQEEQLAAHLEEQRTRLLELRDQVKQERTVLKDERLSIRQEEERAREEAVRERKQARKERRRFVELRKRLKRRWNQQWKEQANALRRQEENVAAERQRQEEDSEYLRREREDLQQRQLRFNGDSELGRRELREEWQKLQLAQQLWEEALNREEDERDRRNRALVAAAQAQAEDERRWRQQRDALVREVEGLESRLRNQRQRLTDQEHRLAHVEEALKARPEEPVVEVRSTLAAHAAETELAPKVPAFLERLAGDLTDQRRRLREQWQRVLQVEAQWQQDRNIVIAELERSGRFLELRDQRFIQQEHALVDLEAELRQRQDALVLSRSELEAGHARLRVQQTEWETQLGVARTEVRAREAVVAGRLQRLEALRQHRSRRRRAELEEIRNTRAQCEQSRQQYLALLSECQQRRASLAQEQRALASQTVAMERFRLAYLSKMNNTATAERRLERLRRRAAARIAAAERELIAERAALQAEAARLEERAVSLHEQEGILAVRQGEWTEQEPEREEQQLTRRDRDDHQQQEVKRWQTRYEIAERALNELRDEVERLARLLMDEVDPMQANQAA